MNLIFEQFAKIGVIPVVVLDDAKNAAPLAKILSENDLPCAQIAFQTPCAEEAIKIMTTEFPDMLVGAGSIRTIEQADRAINAGAQFIVSGGINPKIVQHCLDETVIVLPGVQTPTEIEQALELSLTVVQFFPAEPAGGLNMIKALAQCYDELRFMPSGGINSVNLMNYLSYEKVVACGGDWIVRRDLINAGQLDKVELLVKEASKIVQHIRRNAT